MLGLTTIELFSRVNIGRDSLSLYIPIIIGPYDPNYESHNLYSKSQNVNYKPYNSLIVQASI